MDDMSANRGRSGGRRVVIALASCVFGAALILLASQMGSKSADETASVEEGLFRSSAEKENPARLEHCSG